MLFIFCCLLAVQGFSQENRFVYIQSENGSPFYVRMGKQIFSSTASGYVILSKLKEGNFQLNVGFPRNEYPEEEFYIAVKGQNEGYLLKNMGDRWILFNIETMAVTEGSKSMVQQTAAQQEKAPDAFSSLLADVVKDSSILQDNVAKKEPAVTAAQAKTEKPGLIAGSTERVKQDTSLLDTGKTEVTGQVSKIETGTVDSAKLAASGLTEQADATSAASHSVSTSGTPGGLEGSMKKTLSMKESNGLDLVYVDTKLKDTIRLFMPVVKQKAIEGAPRELYNPDAGKAKTDSTLTITPTIVTAPPAEVSAMATDTTSKKIPANGSATETMKTVDLPAPKKDTLNSNAQADKIAPPTKKEEKSAQIIYTPSVNSDCSSYATGIDFLKLRKKMAGESDNDKMVEVARKAMKTKCYTTQQVKDLSYLFLDDEGKYKFFDAVYPFTSDSNLFYQLESQLKDPYYINRFKAMIHK